MNWLLSLIFDTSSFAHGFLVYSVIISFGIGLGRKKIFGLSLGATCRPFCLLYRPAGWSVFLCDFQKQRVRADRLDDARCRIKPFNHYFTVFPIFQQHFPS